MGRYTKFTASARFPASPEELAQVLADPQAASEMFGSDPQSWQDFGRHYAAACPELAELAQLESQRQLQATSGYGFPRAISGRPGAGGRNRCYNAKAPGCAIDDVLGGGEHQLARLFQAVNPKYENGAGVRGAIQAAMSERIPSSGGFLVPENLRADLLTLMLESAIIRPRTRIVPMDSLRVPFPSIDDTSHSGSSGVFGGVSAYWAEESATLAASAPAFSRILLEARKLAFYTTIPNELIQDAGPLLDEWLRAQIPAAMTWFEDWAFINGSGVGEPEGILNSPAAIRVPVTNVNTIVLADIIAAYTRIWPPSLKSSNLVWLTSPTGKKQLLSLALTSNSTTIAPPSWLTGMQAIDGEPTRLLGIPLITSEKMPDCSSGNTTVPGALTLADLSYFLIGERFTMQVAVSEEYLFANDLTAYRVLERLDARTWVRSALTPSNGGSTLSPFVKIDTTATS